MEKKISYGISLGNRMDERAVWEKIALTQKNCTMRSGVLFKMLECYH